MSRQRLTVKVFGGNFEVLTGTTVWISVIQSNGKIAGKAVVSSGEVIFDLGEDLTPIEKRVTVSAEAKGFMQSGIIGKLLESDEAEVNLLLLSKEAKFKLQGSRPWQQNQSWPSTLPVADSDFDSLVSADPLRAAFVLNFAEAILNIPGGKNLLETLQSFPATAGDENSRKQQLHGVLPDRMLTFSRSLLVERLQEMERKGQFDKASGAAHGKPQPDQKRYSWKETLYEEAGIQFTVFDNAAADKAFVDIDFDYFKDGVSHFLVEYLPNQVFKRRTHPMQVYARRWMQARNFSGEEERVFSPAYRWIA